MKKYWPIIIITLVSLILFFTNLHPQKYLLGWDNLFPEINPLLNLSRNLNGVWLEYRGLGLLDGLSFIANITHTLLISLLSLIVPQWLIRYSVMLGLHWLGGVGCYVLINSLVKNKVVSLTGALFYMLNLATVQMFYTPYEVFAYHFAFLPWLIWSLFRLRVRTTLKNIVTFALLNVLATPQAHVPTVFVVYIVAVFTLTIALFSLKNWKKWFKKTLLIGTIILVTNAFWLFPYVYSFIKNSSVIANATINQITTDEVVLNNHIFGTFSGTALLRGFNLVYLDHTNGQPTYLMETWRDHIFSLWTTIGGWTLFLIAGAGIIFSLKKHTHYTLPIVFLFLISFFMLGNEIPLFSGMHTLLNTKISFFYQAYRFVFTKFSTLYTLTYSILLSMGLIQVLNLVPRQTTKIKYSTALGVIVVTFYMCRLSFDGHFFYQHLFVSIPQEYHQVISYFKAQPKQGRILVLPIPTFWGWTNNTWGYRGSGWLWQAIEQPMTDRAFDPWSKENETMYLEFAHALYGKDQVAFASLLRKYDIAWVMLDESIFSSVGENGLEFIPEIDKILSQTQSVNREFKQGKITVFKNSIANPETFVNSLVEYREIKAEITYTNKDFAYLEGNYVGSPQINSSIPFASLDERTGTKITIKRSENEAVSFEKNVTVNTPSFLQIPDYFDNQIVPVQIWIAKNEGNTNIALKSVSPQITSNNSILLESETVSTTRTYSVPGEDVHFIFINSQVFDIRWIKDGNPYFLGYMPLKVNHPIDVEIGKNAALTELPNRIDYYEVSKDTLILSYTAKASSNLTFPPGLSNLKVIFPVKISNDIHLFGQPEPYNCDVFKRGSVEKTHTDTHIAYKATNDGINCDFIDYRRMKGYGSYVIGISGKNNLGRSLKFYVTSVANKRVEKERLAPVEGMLFDHQTKKFDIATMIQPADDRGLVLNVETRAFGDLKSENTINQVNIIPIYADWLQRLKITPDSEQEILEHNSSVVVNKVNHPNSALYNINLSGQGVLTLSQSYEDGWIALQGRTLLPHVKVNGWANGWILDEATGRKTQGEEVTIFYWPQLLEWFGLGVLVIAGGMLTYKTIRKSN